MSYLFYIILCIDSQQTIDTVADDSDDEYMPPKSFCDYDCNEEKLYLYKNQFIDNFVKSKDEAMKFPNLPN